MLEMQKRIGRFIVSWYKDHIWLEYLDELDAVFCFHCRVFIATVSKKIKRETICNNFINPLLLNGRISKAHTRYKQ